MLMDNSLSNRGTGNWIFRLYNPEDIKVGPIPGVLKTSKDFHIILDTEDEDKCVASFPNQNIAYVYDSDYYKEPDTE